MELALGTVQFGLAYGVAGRGSAVPPEEARQILGRAWELGIRTLDTAAAYGDIEARLRQLAGDHPFDVVTKLPPFPSGLDTGMAANWAHRQIGLARERLGTLLKGLLLHRAEDLLEPQGDALWTACSTSDALEGVALGVSCYGPDALAAVAARYPLSLAQAPGNALDQRLHAVTRVGPALHVRSAFLQGLLLLPLQVAAERVPAAAESLRRWHHWCAQQRLAPLVAALGLVKSIPGATHCVVGVDNQQHLESIVAAWNEAPALSAPELAVDDSAITDPRQWPRLAT